MALRVLLAPSPLAGEGWGEGDGAPPMAWLTGCGRMDHPSPYPLPQGERANQVLTYQSFAAEWLGLNEEKSQGHDRRHCGVAFGFAPATRPATRHHVTDVTDVTLRHKCHNVTLRHKCHNVTGYQSITEQSRAHPPYPQHGGTAARGDRAVQSIQPVARERLPFLSAAPQLRDPAAGS